MLNFSKLQGLLNANRISLGITKPLFEDVEEQKQPSAKQPVKVNTSNMDVWHRYRDLNLSFHNIPAAPLVASIKSSLRELHRTTKNETVVDLTSYLTHLLATITNATKVSNSDEAVSLNLSKLRSELITTLRNSIDHKTKIMERLDYYADTYLGVYHNYKPVESIVGKLLRHIMKSAGGLEGSAFIDRVFSMLDTNIDLFRSGSRRNIVSMSDIVFPSTDLAVSDTDTDDADGTSSSGLTQSLETVYKTIKQFMEKADFTTSDDDQDLRTDETLAQLLTSIESQVANTVVAHTKPRAYSMAAVTNPKQVNKVLISYKPEGHNPTKSKSLRDLTSRNISDTTDKLVDITDSITGRVDSLQGLARGLTMPDSHETIWKAVKSYFDGLDKRDDPDAIKLALALAPADVFKQFIDNKGLVNTLQSSEVSTKNMYVSSIDRISQAGQDSIVTSPALAYLVKRIKSSTNKTLNGAITELTDDVKLLAEIPSDFFAGSIATSQVGNITDQIYYRLAVSYGSHADLQRLEKAPGVVTGSKQFLTRDAVRRISNDLDELENTRKSGESLLKDINTTTSSPHVRMKSIFSILGIKKPVSGNRDPIVNKVAKAIGDALDITSILSLATGCKDIKGATRTEKFKSDLFDRLASCLDKIDPNIGNLFTKDFDSESGSTTATAANPGVISAIYATRAAINSLTDNDIAKIVSALATNTDLLKYASERKTTIKLTDPVKSEFNDLLQELESIINTHSGDSANLVSNLAEFKKSVDNNDVSILEFSNLVNLILDNPELSDNSEIHSRINTIKIMIKLPTESELVHITAQQYVGVKSAIDALVAYRKLDAVFTDKLRNTGFDLVLNDFDSFVKPIDEIQIDFLSDEERLDYLKTRKKLAGSTKSVENAIDIVQNTQAVLNKKKEDAERLARVLLPSSTLSGRLSGVSPKELKKFYYRNLQEFQSYAKLVYSKIQELVENNPKLIAYLTSGSGVKGIDHIQELAPEQQEASEHFDQFLLARIKATGKDVDPTEALYDESGANPKFKVACLAAYTETQDFIADTSGEDFNASIYEIFAPVIELFQRRLSTSTPGFVGESSPSNMPKSSKSAAKLQSTGGTALQSELYSDFSDSNAVAAIRAIPNNKLKSVIGEFFPGKSEEDLIRLKNSVIYADELLDNWDKKTAENEAAERHNKSLSEKNAKIELNNAQIQKENELLSDTSEWKQLEELHPLFTVHKLGKRPKPQDSPVLKDLVTPEILADLKTKLQAVARSSQVETLPAFKTFANLIKMGLDNGDIQNPVRVEPQSTSANIAPEAAAFLSLAASLVTFKDANNFLLGSFRTIDIVDNLFNSSSYPAAVCQDKNIVLCTRLYIIKQLLAAASAAKLDTAFADSSIKFCDDDAINSQAQDVYKTKVAAPIIATFSASGALSIEYKNTLDLLRISIKGSNNVVPLLTSSGDLVKKTEINADDDGDLNRLITSRGYTALNIMRESEQVSDNVKPLLRLLLDNASIVKLATRFNNCITIISSGINYTMGRELLIELAKRDRLSEFTAVRNWDADSKWSQFVNRFKLVSSELTSIAPDPTDSTGGTSNLRNKYLRTFLNDFNINFKKLRRSERDTKAKEFDTEALSSLSNQKTEVQALPASIIGIFTDDGYELVTGSIGNLTSKTAQKRQARAIAAAKKAAERHIASGSRMPSESSDLSLRPSVSGEEVDVEAPYDTDDAEAAGQFKVGVAAGGTITADISTKIKKEVESTLDLLNGYVKSGSVRSSQPVGPLHNNNSIIGVKKFLSREREALSNVRNLFARFVTGLDNSSEIQQELNVFYANMIRGIAEVGYAFYGDPENNAGDSLYSDGSLDKWSVAKQQAAIKHLGSISSPLVSGNSIVAKLLITQRKFDTPKLDDLEYHYKKVMGEKHEDPKKKSRVQNAAILWATIINENIVSGHSSGEDLFNQFIPLLKAAEAPATPVLAPTPVKPEAPIKRASAKLATASERATFQSNFRNQFFSFTGDVSVLTQAAITAITPTEGSTTPPSNTAEIKVFLGQLVASIVKQIEGNITLFNNAVKTGTPEFRHIENLFVTTLQPIVSHINGLLLLDNAATTSIEDTISKLTNQIEVARKQVDKLKVSSELIENLIKYNLSSTITEAVDTPDENSDDINAEKLASTRDKRSNDAVIGLSKSLNTLVAYYKFRFQAKNFEDAAEFAEVMAEIKNEFLVTFLFRCLPKSAEYIKWDNIAGRTEPYIKFSVLAQLVEEFRTGGTYESASLDTPDSSDPTKKVANREYLDIPLMDIESLGWLGSHTFANAGYFSKDTTDTTPDEV